MNTAAQLPHVLADDLALDFLNTVALVDGAPHDFLSSEGDVQAWLSRMGAHPSKAVEVPAQLLSVARGLRSAIKALVERRMRGEHGDPRHLNEFLATAPSFSRLTWVEGKAPELTQVRPEESATQWLAPVALAAAELIAKGDFDLVRKCEHPECSLLFYDRTKSHRRRWCSMALCGNRHKVAEFRKRRTAGT